MRAPAMRGRGGAVRPRRRRGPEERQGSGWLVLPATMTLRGRAGEIYQVPFAPPPAGHELVGGYGSTPVYTTLSSLVLSFDFP